jgi:hypothetical protein
MLPFHHKKKNVHTIQQSLFNLMTFVVDVQEVGMYFKVHLVGREGNL